MGLHDRFNPQVSRRVRGGVLSAALHALLLLVILSGGRHDGTQTGDELISMPLMLDAADADRGDVVEEPLPEPIAPTPPSESEFATAVASLAPAPADVPMPELAEYSPPEAPPAAATEADSFAASDAPATVAMSDQEKAALSQRLEQIAENSADNSRTETTWQQDGKQFSAVLVREPANDGSSLEQVVARVTTSDRGKYLTTLVNLRRLSFSQFTQMVDFWDPMVQLHDDEIVGRFHSNTRVKMLYDSRTAPAFLGKVTTSARSFEMESHGRKRDSEIFRGGKETRTSKIELPESVEPSEWTPEGEDARVHKFTEDAHIRFLPDGSYTWRGREDGGSTFNTPADGAVYFVGGAGVTLYVQGRVAGKMLVYSPFKIVIEGNLTYADDPRGDPGSDDYLGLVSQRYVEVAPPGIIGPGDLEVDAAIYAGRRFIVTSIDHARSATLRIYGSLAAGTLTATEPRYATRIEYDDRFEHERPPGFPSTNRYEAAAWDGRWVEAP